MKLTKKNLWFDYEKPNVYLYTFTGNFVSKFGKIYISIGKIQNEKKEDIALNANNFILRGCSLRNSKWTIGCVAYSGLFSNNLRFPK